MKSISTSILVAACAAVFLAGCASTAHVRVDQAPSVDMRAYRTFAFAESAAGDRSLVAQHITAATRRQLESAGYVYDEKAPQLRVNFMLKVAEKVDIDNSPKVSSPYHGHHVISRSVETTRYKVGTLRIDLVDAGKRAVVWQGVAENRLGEKEMEQPGAAVDRAVADIFAKFAGAKPAPAAD